MAERPKTCTDNVCCMLVIYIPIPIEYVLVNGEWNGREVTATDGQIRSACMYCIVFVHGAEAL